MAMLSRANEAQLKAQLQDAVVCCSERGLYHASKWAAEMLNSFPPPQDDGSETDIDSPMSDVPAPDTSTKISRDPRELQLESRELHKFLLAKAYFDSREYDRCAAVFLPELLPKAAPPFTASPTAKLKQPSKAKAKAETPTKLKSMKQSWQGISQKSMFLALYAKFLAGEKRMNEDSEMILGPQDGGMTTNKELPALSTILEDWFSSLPSSGRQSQGWLEYMYGIILAKGKNEKLALDYFLRGIHQYPYNWGAWQEMGNLLGTVEELTQVIPQLPMNIMTYIFHIYVSQELFQTGEDTHTQVLQALEIFPASTFLQTQRALLFVHAKEHEEAEQIFSKILVTDPYRLDSLDNYSNLLFVTEDRPKLAFLAQLATNVDRFRPETCCVVGNYYSMKAEPEKAVVYFRRALQLDRRFISAWTLMGHEYLEMKNNHAAIESYRHAVDINRKDYRAWYGLGQAYEMLDMHTYAIFYHQRAAALKPYDSKFWMALATCFERMNKVPNAIRALKRALVAGSLDNGVGTSFASGDSAGLGGGLLDQDILSEIAELYLRINNEPECAAYMELVVAQEEGPENEEGEPGGGTGPTGITGKAKLWLAGWEFRRGMYQRAQELATELCQDGFEVEEAKALLRDIRARTEREKEQGVE